MSNRSLHQNELEPPPIASFPTNLVRIGDHYLVRLEDYDRFISAASEGVSAGEESPTLLKLKDVARLLSVSRSTVYRLINRDGLPCLRIGTIVRVPGDELAQWVAARTVRRSSN